MFTAILPIRINKNSFWASDLGMAKIDDWLRMISDNSNIERIFVIAQDGQACCLAGRHGIQALDVAIPGNIERSYTFEQTIAMWKNFRHSYSDPVENLIVADHRNIMLSSEDLENAMSFYMRHPDSWVVSLAYCRDHPCQFKSYQTFLGCATFLLKDTSYNIPNPSPKASHLVRIISCSDENDAGISITVKFEDKGCRIAVESDMYIPDILVAHILPLTKNGIVYERFIEIHITDSDHLILDDFNFKQLEGLVVTLFRKDLSGSYDTVECFTPKNATWKLGQSQDVIVDGGNNHTIQGRQQFPPVYTYDGSFCIFHTVKHDHKNRKDLIPVILKNSCIVSDWIDYYSCVSN